MLISVSGKIGSGKDTVGLIIQYLLDHRINTTHPDAKDEDDHLTFMDFTTWKEKEYYKYSNWKVKKFADKLKEICSMLTGIPRADFEKEEVKNIVMPKHWQLYEIFKNGDFINITRSNLEAAHDFCGEDTAYSFSITARTYRWLLQNLGTNALRDVIHPNVWVNSLFADYKAIGSRDSEGRKFHTLDKDELIYPDWVITDCRFPNELSAIKKRDGITIRAERTGWASEPQKMMSVQHESETALDNAKFDYTIENNGSIEELIVKVKVILIERKLL